MNDIDHHLNFIRNLFRFEGRFDLPQIFRSDQNAVPDSTGMCAIKAGER